MTREEMIAFLRENLSIAVTVGSINYDDCDEVSVSVKLLLGESVISSDTDTVTVWHKT
jgi:hypothetical protein